MTASRRAFLATGVTGALALSAGCVDFVRGEGPLEFDAEQVVPSDKALEETGFDELEIHEEALEETVEFGVEREVRASLWISSYTKAVEISGQSENATAFVAISTPDISVAGRSFNPIDDMDSEELLDEFMGEMESDQADISDIEHEETFSVSILEEGRDVDLLRGRTEYQDEQIDIDLVVTSFSHENDYIVLVGTYPEMFQDEGDDVESLLESVEHPA